MKSIPTLMFLGVLALPAAAFVDQLKDTIERAAKSEVQRKADQETRRLTRCALGDTRCVR